MMRIVRALPCLVAVITLYLPSLAGAAGFLDENGAGAPLVWTVDPVPFNPDQGTLGALDNASAVGLVTHNFNVWGAVTTATISFTNAGALPEDVTAATINNYLGVCNDGLNPIVFDTDGTITDAIFGVGASNSVLGFAGPDCVSYVPPQITEASAVLNGKWVDGINTPSNPEISLTDFTAVFTHEFGHYFNLDHSQINLIEAFDNNPANDNAIATMFPFLVNGAETASLNLDDEVSVSQLYPAAWFGTNFGKISGHIFLSDGTTPFQGAYVIARKVGDPRISAVGVASGARYAPGKPGGPPASSLQGLYEIPGLPPADYTVEIEAIDPQFTQGSSVGPLDPPLPLPGPPEFYNGANESNANPPDDPTAATPVTVTAGSTVSNVDIIMNNLCPMVPSGTCLNAGKMLLSVKGSPNPTGQGFLWMWENGQATTVGDFGDPVNGTTSYVLCLYDETGGVPALTAQLLVPPSGTCGSRPCWTAPSSGYKYTNHNPTLNGVSLILLKSGIAGKSKVILKGKGGTLPGILPLNEDAHVTVQFVRSDAATCFSTVFTAPPKTSSSLQFKDTD